MHSLVKTKPNHDATLLPELVVSWNTDVMLSRNSGKKTPTIHVTMLPELVVSSHKYAIGAQNFKLDKGIT
jgi:hypothetical protein